METSDDFDCIACGRHIISLPKQEVAPTKCATCTWLDEYVTDPEEREALRQKLNMEY
jgi:hypothetical protein